MVIWPLHRRGARRPLLAVTLLTFAGLLSAKSVTAQSDGVRTSRETTDSTFRRHFVGSSLWMLYNVAPDPPLFFQLNYGYRPTPNDVFSVEAITWKYKAPLGIPYGPSYVDENEEYPGSVQSFGVGLAYQRFWHKQWYSALHALPLLQRYSDSTGNHLQNGFQLFMTFRTGYQVRLFSDRWFIEPNVAFTAWPINTNVPESFATLERKWPKYFLFEPGLHFGRRF